MKIEKKTLSVISLVMINVIAIDSVRTLPMGAEYGFSLVFYYLMAAVLFFLPVSLVAAELATGWPETGGVYVWVREAFGKKTGFVAIWLQWFYNVCWYPTIMATVAATLAYCIDPNLVKLICSAPSFLFSGDVRWLIFLVWVHPFGSARYQLSSER
jgi:amino acid transporter